MRILGKGCATYDIAAIAILLTYLALAYTASSGGSVAGQSLDTTWSRVQERGELRVAIDVGFAPFSAEQGGQVIGYDADLAHAVALSLGVRAIFVPTGFDALYDRLARGEADLIASALPYTPEQGWRGRQSRFYFNAGQVLLVPVGSPITGTEQLAGRRVGAVLGSDGDTLLRRFEREGLAVQRHTEYDDLPPLLRDLQATALDAVILDNASALTAIAEAPTLHIAAALSVEPYVLAVPPAAYALHERVNAALETLERNGCFTALNQRWLRSSPIVSSALPEACR